MYSTVPESVTNFRHVLSISYISGTTQQMQDASPIIRYIVFDNQSVYFPSFGPPRLLTKSDPVALRSNPCSLLTLRNTLHAYSMFVYSVKSVAPCGGLVMINVTL